MLDGLWFVAMDVADMLGYEKTNRLSLRLEDFEVVIHKVGYAVDGKQDIILINESGLYHAIFKSRNPGINIPQSMTGCCQFLGLCGVRGGGMVSKTHMHASCFYWDQNPGGIGVG